MNGSNNESSDSTPLPYTASPIQLLGSEVKLIKDIIFYYPASFLGIVRPAWSSNTEDELCLTNPKNVRSLLLHGILIITQSLFLVALVYGLLIPVPAAAYLLFVISCLTLNFYFCKLLNGDGSPQTSNPEILSSFSPSQGQEKERFIFINGVSVGRDWFQANLDTLSLIFRRPIVGIHNITYGIIFDLLECLIQRDFCYATQDIRTGYAQVKASLLDEKLEKVVLLVHSQGGIEFGAILDWLFDDLPASRLRKLEIYTFGSAANHFNNPSRSHQSPEREKKLGVVRYIEHYTNSGDFVSRFGILGFIKLTGNMLKKGTRALDGEKNKSNPKSDGPSTAQSEDHNRFRGRLFKRNATGHMLNQHYLAHMFTREKVTLKGTTTTIEQVAETNIFMDSEISVWNADRDQEGLGWGWMWLWMWPSWFKVGDGVKKGWDSMVVEDGVDLCRDGKRDAVLKPKNLSRLWMYRNGGSPPKDEDEEQTTAAVFVKEAVDGVNERAKRKMMEIRNGLADGVAAN